MPIPTKQEIRAEFHKLKAKQAELEAKLKPLQKKYDEARELERLFVEKTVKPHELAMKPLAGQLYDVNAQLGEIVRYLRDASGIAQTGDPVPAH